MYNANHRLMKETEAAPYVTYQQVNLIIVSLIFIIPIIKLEGTEKEHENRKPDNNSTWKATQNSTSCF